MSRYPRAARNARVKCIECNAPVVETTDGGFVCVDCGDSPIQRRDGDGGIETDADATDPGSAFVASTRE